MPSRFSLAHSAHRCRGHAGFMETQSAQLMPMSRVSQSTQRERTRPPPAAEAGKHTHAHPPCSLIIGPKVSGWREAPSGARAGRLLSKKPMADVNKGERMALEHPDGGTEAREVRCLVSGHTVSEQLLSGS